MYTYLYNRWEKRLRLKQKIAANKDFFLIFDQIEKVLALITENSSLLFSVSHLFYSLLFFDNSL